MALKLDSMVLGRTWQKLRPKISKR